MNGSRSCVATLHRLVILLLMITSCIYIVVHVCSQCWLMPRLSVVFQTSYFLVCMVNGLVVFRGAFRNFREIVVDSELPHGIFVIYAAVVAIMYARAGVVFFVRDPNWFTGVRGLIDICYQFFAINPLIVHPWLVLNGSRAFQRRRREKLPLHFKIYHAELVADTNAFSRIYGAMSIGTVIAFYWFVVFDACLVLFSSDNDHSYRSFLIVPMIYLTTSVLLVTAACEGFVADGRVFRKALRRALLEQSDLATQIDLRLLFETPPHPVPGLPGGGSLRGLFGILASLAAYGSLLITSPSMDTFKWVDNSSVVK